MLIILPRPLQSLAIAEPLEGPTLGRYRALAAEQRLWLSVGGFQEQGPDPQHLHNCHVIIDDNGAVVAKYRKVRRRTVDSCPGGCTQLGRARLGRRQRQRQRRRRRRATHAATVPYGTAAELRADGR